MDEIKFSLSGYEMIKKKVNIQGTSGRVYVPISWVGEDVAIVRMTKRNDDAE